MEQASLYTWNGLLWLLVNLTGVYLILWLLLTLLKNFGKRDLSKRKAIQFLTKGLLIYKSVALIVLLLGFISINYITHGLLLAFLGVFGYRYIRDYISGGIIKLNNSIKKGDTITIGEINGVVERLLTFGISVSNPSGENYFSYTTMEQKGFAVKSDKHSLLRRTIFINTTLSSEKVLDQLFENPILSISDPPSVRSTGQPDHYRLQYTLEKGSSSEDLQAFLHEINIETSLQNNN